MSAPVLIQPLGALVHDIMPKDDRIEVRINCWLTRPQLEDLLEVLGPKGKVKLVIAEAD